MPETNLDAIIVKTFRYGPYTQHPKFNLQVAFARLKQVYATIKAVSPAGRIVIAVPDDEYEMAKEVLPSAPQASVITLQDLPSSDLLQLHRDLLIIDEQAFYTSPHLIEKVQSISHDGPKTWKDTNNLLYAYNYTSSCYFTIAKPAHIKNSLNVLLDGEFSQFLDALTFDANATVEIDREDIFHSYKIATSINKHPYVYYIEPTSKCNAKCTMCPFHSSQMDIAKGRLYIGEGGCNMSLGTFCKLVDEVAALPWLYLPHYRNAQIVPQLRGEPLLAPHIKPMLKYIKDRGISISFSTNGSMLHLDNLAEFLVDIGADEIVISIDKDSAEYNQVRPQLNYEQVVKNIAHLRQIRDAKGKSVPQIVTKAVIKKGDSLDSFDEYFSKFTRIADSVGVCMENYDDPNHECKRFYSNIFEVDDSMRMPCLMVMDVAVIKADGDVDLCFGGAEHLLGNINNDSLLHIIEHSRLRQTVFANESHTTQNFAGETEFCRHCSSWKCMFRKHYIDGQYDVSMNPIMGYWKLRTEQAPGSASAHFSQQALARIKNKLKKALHSITRPA